MSSTTVVDPHKMTKPISHADHFESTPPLPGDPFSLGRPGASAEDLRALDVLADQYKNSPIHR